VNGAAPDGYWRTSVESSLSWTFLMRRVSTRLANNYGLATDSRKTFHECPVQNSRFGNEFTQNLKCWTQRAFACRIALDRRPASRSQPAINMLRMSRIRFARLLKQRSTLAFELV
jgi:hypothetical protein